MLKTTFQKLMGLFLHSLQLKECLTYLDNVLILNTSSVIPVLAES